MVWRRWPVLLTPNASVSAREEVPLSIVPPASGKRSSNLSADASCALIHRDWKIVTGDQGMLGFWQGKRYPVRESEPKFCSC